MAVAMVIPADGPSFGTAPPGYEYGCHALQNNHRHIVLRTDGAHVSQCSHGRFFMTSPIWPVSFNSPFTRHDIHLDLKGVTAHTGPCKSPDNANLILLIGILKGNLFLAKDIFPDWILHTDVLFFMLQVLSCRLSADFSYAALEISDTRLHGYNYG